MAHTGSRRAQKWANFFSHRTKILPPAKGPKRALSAGAWGLVPKSAVWGPPNAEIRNLRPPKFGKKNFFRTCNIFFPKVHPKRSLTHPHRPPSDQNCPIASGSNFFPMWSCPGWDPCVLPLIRADPGTFPVAGIWIRANFGARIRSHLPAGPPGALG